MQINRSGSEHSLIDRQEKLKCNGHRDWDRKVPVDGQVHQQGQGRIINREMETRISTNYSIYGTTKEFQFKLRIEWTTRHLSLSTIAKLLHHGVM